MSTLDVQTLTNVQTIKSNGSGPPTVQNSSGTEIGQFSRAWVYFNASTGTPVITGAFNVASITDNGVGNFTVNFSNAMPDANYCAILTAESGLSVSPRAAESSTQTASNVSFYTYTFQSGVAAGAAQDMNHNKVSVFR
jgi:hypothetical protein